MHAANQQSVAMNRQSTLIILRPIPSFLILHTHFSVCKISLNNNILYYYSNVLYSVAPFVEC